MSQRNPQRLSKWCRNWNSISKRLLLGRSQLQATQSVFPLSKFSPNLLDKLETKARRRSVFRFVDVTSLGGFGVGWGLHAPGVLRYGRLSPSTLARKNFGFSKMICLVGKIRLHNLNVVLYNFWTQNYPKWGQRIKILLIFLAVPCSQDIFRFYVSWQMDVHDYENSCYMNGEVSKIQPWSQLGIYCLLA